MLNLDHPPRASVWSVDFIWAKNSTTIGSTKEKDEDVKDNSF